MNLGGRAKEKGEEYSRQRPTSLMSRKREKALFEEPKEVLYGLGKRGRDRWKAEQ